MIFTDVGTSCFSKTRERRINDSNTSDTHGQTWKNISLIWFVLLFLLLGL